MRATIPAVSVTFQAYMHRGLTNYGNTHWNCLIVSFHHLVLYPCGLLDKDLQNYMPLIVEFTNWVFVICYTIFPPFESQVRPATCVITTRDAPGMYTILHMPQATQYAGMVLMIHHSVNNT